MRHLYLLLFLFFSAAGTAQCLLEADLTGTFCEDSLNVFYADVFIAGGPNDVGQWEVVSADGTYFSLGSYPGSVTLGPFPAGEEVLLIFTDSIVANCQDTLLIFSPDCPIQNSCGIFAEPIRTQCDSTTGNYFLDILVDTDIPIGSPGWEATFTGGDTLLSGNYGSIATFGPYPGNSFGTIIFTDLLDPNCQTALSFADPGCQNSICDSLTLNAFLSVTDTSCTEEVFILVEYFSVDYPLTLTLTDAQTGAVESQEVTGPGITDFLAPGPGLYFVLAETPNGCTENSQFISVDEFFGLNVSIVQEGSFCSDSSATTLTALVDGQAGGNYSYVWSTGDTTSTIADLTVWETYGITVTDNSLGCTGESFFLVTINEADSLNFITFSEPFVLGCDTDSVFIIPNEIRPGYTYTWYGPLNQIFQGPGFWALMQGTYYLQAITEKDSTLSGFAEVVSASLNEDLIDIFVFNDDSICSSENCLFLAIQGTQPNAPNTGISVTWETPNELADSIANNNPFGVLCTPIPGLYRATITTECDTVVRSVFLEDPLGCSSLSGILWADQAADCNLDAEDTPVPNYILLLTNDATGEMYYVLTDASGHWEAELPVGTYTIAPSQTPGSPFGVCEPPASAVLGNFPVTGVQVFLPVTAACPQLTTSVTLPFLRRCFNNLAWVEYTNTGSATAENAQLTVTLDDFFVDAQASPAPTTQEGTTFTFALGDVPPFASGVIVFRFTVSCAADLGQSHCIDAAITPDEPCNPDPLWDGALVNVAAVGCVGDSVLFQVRNIGEEQMSVPLSYVIVEDGIMLRETPFINGLLNPNEVMEIYLPANGSTYHIITNQEPNAPADSAPTAVLEGCANGGQTVSTGFANILDLANGPLTSTTVCLENVGSYDPNDKRGYPLGFGETNAIPEGTRLDYTIRFQNTGTDTAFTVVIRDTMPVTLDLATLEIEGASHPFTVSLDTHRVLSFVFENILLPDSSVNLAGSQGAVQFSINHNKELNPGDQILNEAAIYFDFNDPIITNRSRHTIDKEGLPTSTRAQLARQLAVAVFPNPSTGRINIRLPDQAASPQDALVVMDLYGRQLARTTYVSAANGWDLSHLTPGYYLVVVEDANGRARGRAGFVLAQ